MSTKYPVYKFQIDEIDGIYLSIIKKWCNDNCKKSWKIRWLSISPENDTIRMYLTFIEEAEAVAFKLRWM